MSRQLATMAPPGSPMSRRAALSQLDVNTPSKSAAMSNIKPSLPVSTPSRLAVTSPMAAGARTSLSLSTSGTPISSGASSSAAIAKRKVAVLGEETPGGRAGKYACFEQSEEAHRRLPVAERAANEVPGREAHRSSQGTARESPSPSSTFDTTEDSPNTLVTEPEDSTYLSAVGGTGPIGNPAEVRELAETLKLRLQIALYKVRTNQLDLPLSQLEVRSASPRLNPKHRSKLSVINLDETPVWNVRSSPPMSASPPLRRRLVSSGNSPSNLALATPLLPRSREELKFDTPGRQDLTSSVVKGRAADGLLRLMGAVA